MELQLNNPSVRDQYLRGLNICFRGWGGQNVYAWVFDRQLQNCPPTDQLVLLDDRDPVAGSAISYREVAVRTGKRVLAGIMTGSWTLPEARGRGCFSRLIKESVHLSQSRGAVLLLAFVAENNPSWRRLAESGAAAFPACYAVLAPEKTGTVETLELQEIAAPFEGAVDRYLHRDPGNARFRYGAADWAGQFLKRPAGIVCLGGDDGSVAVVELQPDTDRLLFCQAGGDVELWVASIAKWASARRRKLFAYATDQASIRLFGRLGFQPMPGFLTAHVLDPPALAVALDIPHAQVSEPGRIADPSSPWFLGEWQLQAGDRM